MTRGPGWKIRGQSTPEAEALLAIERLMEATNLPVFNI